jgi:hypothetical protein
MIDRLEDDGLPVSRVTEQTVITTTKCNGKKLTFKDALVDIERYIDDRMALERGGTSPAKGFMFLYNGLD